MTTPQTSSDPRREVPHADVQAFMPEFSLDHPALQQDPYPTYAQMREQCPVARSDKYGGYWILSRYDEAKFVHQTTEYFSTRHISIPPVEYPLGPEIPLHIDPPEHMKYRQPLLKMFSPAQAQAAEGHIREVAVRLLEAMIADGSTDFLAGFAVPLPCLIFCELMGVPKENLTLFLKWKDDYLRAPTAERAQRIQQMYGGVASMFSDEWESRGNLDDPGDDIIGKLMKMEYNKERKLTKNEFIRTARFLFFAGLDTVTSQLALMVHYLGTHLDKRDELTREPSLIPAAIEELMRYDTLVGVCRVVKKDVEIGGRTLKEGDFVMSLLNSANRDEKVFSAPDEVHFDRASANRHLGFGVGPHRCLGSHLARTEMRIALEELHRLMPKYRVDPARPVKMHLGTVRGVDSLHLIYD